ncbi:MAG: cation transporter [Deltaproteobacteria bacterium CG_4_10_14_0_2_um_filter_43_8]|nr:MAG: cation transporter [Deltaproteobacteria bacterium CG11_big_fil_rev_8_21_14_0_20_42_23]PJA18878.1 MAG: cation transporter [Deltaproteobacteria bacterium CG_4_10_14_0_2_um_filter_43_8]PJC64711.1 MAG: cation transporter [Deltaproteobacteria bacterium CG_4_9_14_0_2_um_filter_42_21]
MKKRHHHHAENTYRQKEQRGLLISIVINTVTMFLEIGGGIYSGSLALLSDAGHMFSHIFALGVSYFAIRIAIRPANTKNTFGFYRAEILAALLNAVTIFVVAYFILAEAYHRLQDPENIASGPMFVIALIGLSVNALTAYILHDVSKEDMNVRGAFLHMLGDLFSSVGVVIAAIIVKYTGWVYADPIASALIALVISYWAYGLLRDAVHILLQATPKELSVDEIKTSLLQLADIKGVHDVHLWELTKGMYMMTAHIEVEDQPISQVDNIRKQAQHILSERFNINHADLQVQCATKP